MEEVVIAGMSGKLPESENLEEFWANLIGGVDMVTDDDRRWKAGKPAWGSPPTWDVLFSFLTATVDTVSRVTRAGLFWPALQSHWQSQRSPKVRPCCSLFLEMVSEGSGLGEPGTSGQWARD